MQRGRPGHPAALRFPLAFDLARTVLIVMRVSSFAPTVYVLREPVIPALGYIEHLKQAKTEKTFYQLDWVCPQNHRTHPYCNVFILRKLWA